MKYSVDMSLGMNSRLGDHNAFYYAFDGATTLLDLCSKYIHELWSATKEHRRIVITVSDKRFKGSMAIKARVDDRPMLYWSTRQIKEQRIDQLAGEWILERFPIFKDKKTHTLYISAIPDSNTES